MTLDNLPNKKERAKIGRKARQIYAKIQKELEKDHWGDFIATNVENGDYLISSQHGAAAEQMVQKYPETIPYIIRIGEAVHFENDPLPADFEVKMMHDAATSPDGKDERTIFKLTMKSDVPSGKLALTGARIISMKGDEIIENGTVVIDGNRIAAVGAFSVKSYNQPRRNQRQQVLKAARELEMLVVPEGGSTFYHNMNMIVDGHTGIEHSIPIAPLYKDVIELWAASKTGYTPSFVVSYGGLSGEYYWYQHSNVWEKRVIHLIPGLLQ